MGDKLTGSHLTRAMLKRGDKKIWCAIDDDSDEQAMRDQDSNDFKAHIVSFKEGSFYCTGGMPWGFAVPIKIVEIIQHEIGL